MVIINNTAYNICYYKNKLIANFYSPNPHKNLMHLRGTSIEYISFKLVIILCINIGKKKEQKFTNLKRNY